MSAPVFETEVAKLELLNTARDAASEAWNTAYPRDPSWPMGLAPDEVRFSPQYRAYKAAYETANKLCRDQMALINKHFKRQYAKHVRAEIAAKRARSA